MSRRLRPRKSEVSYVALAGIDALNNDGLSGTLEGGNEPDGGSNFAPEADSQDGPGEIVIEDGEDIEDKGGENDDEEDVDNENIAFSAVPKSGEDQAAIKQNPRKVNFTSGVLPHPKRQVYALQTLNINHRPRAVPLFCHSGSSVERLLVEPTLFNPCRTVSTNNFTYNSTITTRVSKAWGFNVGAGPIWELLEDRGWFKEANEGLPYPETESQRRPRVYPNVKVKPGWEVLPVVKAIRYLPHSTGESGLSPASPISCAFGTHDNQQHVDLPMFKSLCLSEIMEGNRAQVFNAGAPVWGLDWCPIHAGDRPGRSFRQYLAVAPFPSRTHSPEIGVRVRRPSYACIQIWSYGPSSQGRSSEEDVEDSGQVKCEMVLCIESGPAHELKWCPLPSHDNLSDATFATRPRKLGLLAGTFEDGSLSIYVVPEIHDIRPTRHDSSQPVFIRLPEPILRLELPETACWALDWANSQIIAVGTTHGTVAIWDIFQALRDADASNPMPICNIPPTHYVSVHQSAIRALCWLHVPPGGPSGATRMDKDPTIIASGGYDGLECLTDVRQGYSSAMNRTRDVINSMTFAVYVGGVVSVDLDNIVKAFSVAPAMLGRGQTLLESAGPIWSLHASDYHPQLAVGSADGTCTTTNMLRMTRRGSQVPFWMHKIYQLDCNRKTGKYRMLDHFLPSELKMSSTSSRDKKKKGDAGGSTSPEPISTGAWPGEVGVNRVVWNSGNGLGAANMLASATALGLCRIDILRGKWLKDRVPYVGIEHIRCEQGTSGMNVDEDDSS